MTTDRFEAEAAVARVLLRDNLHFLSGPAASESAEAPSRVWQLEFGNPKPEGMVITLAAAAKYFLAMSAMRATDDGRMSLAALRLGLRVPYAKVVPDAAHEHVFWIRAEFPMEALMAAPEAVVRAAIGGVGTAVAVLSSEPDGLCVPARVSYLAGIAPADEKPDVGPTKGPGDSSE